MSTITIERRMSDLLEIKVDGELKYTLEWEWTDYDAGEITVYESRKGKHPAEVCLLPGDGVVV